MSRHARSPEESAHPSLQDPLVRSGSAVIGGPLGRRAVVGESWWVPHRVLVLMASLSFALGYVMRLPCRVTDFTNADRYVRMCYSDIPFLYYGRGLSDGLLPYLQRAVDAQPIEYPVLTGWFMWIAARLTGGQGTEIARSSVFYDWNAVLLLGCLLVAVVATALTVRRRPWDAAMLALSPALVMTSLINWDLLAVALTAVGYLLWSRRRPTAAGVLLGLAISAKFYPVVLLAAFVLLCLRAGRVQPLVRLLIGTAAAWLAVNLPVVVLAPQEWARFYTFSRERGVDFGSVYLAAQFLTGRELDQVNTVAMLIMGYLTLLIAVLVVRAPHRPRLAQVSFLFIAAFTMSNKVFSPQFVLWLLPFAVLARPRWRDLLLWQAGQVQYVIAIWLFLEQYGQQDRRGIPEETYAVSIALMVASTVWFCGMVVRDILRPEHDPVRSDGVLAGSPVALVHADDPGGGVLDGAPDRIGGRSRLRPVAHEDAAGSPS